MSEQTTSSVPTTNASSSRRSSVSRSHRRGLSGITPRELKYIDDVIPLDRRQKWKKYSVQPIESSDQFESEFVRNVETTLGRSLFNCDTLAAYQATARSLRDTLIVRWNRTQQKQTLDDPKRVYYLSLEYLMGRALDNAALNLGLEKNLKQGLDDFGFKFEDVVEREPDAGLGNGGLGRLAACFVDSLCTLDYPAWAYGIRYKYGIFRQKIVDGAQVEFPDTWLDFGNPWEIPRPEVSFDVMFYGRVENNDGKKSWIGGDLVEAKAYDFLVPGFDTKNVNTLRLWQAEPSSQFDFARFNEGDYADAVSEQVDASTISAVLYPNDNFYEGKELRLKQQYFWVAASLADILRRFKKTNKPWSEFADSCAIQLNDTHPTLAIVELLRLLVDKEGLDWHEAWAITTSTFAYTNHTVMPEALEKWGVDILGNLLPRHLEIIYNVNYFFLKDVGAKFPGDEGLLSRVSLIEESTPKQVRMAYLAVIASHKVNGVAELHSDLIKTTIFADFVKIFGEEHFTNITNGITPRRWLLEANPELAALIANKLGGYGFIKDLDQLQHIAEYAKDAEFRKQWVKVKQDNKVRLIELIKSQNPGIEIDPTSLFDIQVKRIHEYKRQQLNLFGIVYRYLYIKSLTPEQRSLLAPRVFIFGGKSAPGYYAAKLIIKLINSVGKTIAADPDVNKYLKVVYIEEYNVSKAQILVAASDISEHISTAGTEASGTSNMKFVLNGGLIIGTVDGANIEIGREIGEENIYYFGHLSESVDEVREETKGRVELSDKLAKVFETIDSGVFGEPSQFSSLLDSIRHHGDYYLVNADFDSYINTQSKIDEDFKDQEAWITKSINSVSRMGFFSSDRAINQYAEDIWDIQPNAVEGPDPLSPKPSQANLGPVSAAQGTVAAKKVPKNNKKKRNSVIQSGNVNSSTAATGAGAPTGSGVNVATASAAALGAAGIGAASTSTRDSSPGLRDDTSSQYSNTGSSTALNSATGYNTGSSDGYKTASSAGYNTGATGATSRNISSIGSTGHNTGAATSSGYNPSTSSTGHQTYVVGGPKIVHGSAHNTAAGAAASAAFNKDSSAPRQESYNPLGGADEGQVAGSYGNYGGSATAGTTTGATGSSATTSATTGNYGTSGVSGASNTTEPASYGSAGTSGPHYGTASGAVPAPSHGTLDSTRDTGALKGNSNQTYQALGKSSDLSKSGNDAKVTGTPVPGQFEGGSSQKYSTPGLDTTGTGPVYDSKLKSSNTSANANLSSTTGEYDGGSSQKYDPYGRKGESAVPVHGIESEGPRNSGMFSEISSASSIDTSSVEDDATGSSRNLHRNLVDPGSVSTASVDTAKLNTSSGTAADTSFTGPSSQEIPKNDESSWSNTATGLAAGAGAAVVGAGAALLAKTGLTSDGREGSNSSSHTSSHAGTTDYTGATGHSTTGHSTTGHSTTGHSTTGHSATGHSGTTDYSNTAGHSSSTDYSNTTGHSGTTSDYSKTFAGAKDDTTRREPNSSHGNTHSHPSSSHGYSKDGYDPLGSKNEGQVPVHGAEFATSEVKPHEHHSTSATRGTTDRSANISAYPLEHHSASTTDRSTHGSTQTTSSHGFSKDGYDPLGSQNEGQVPVHGTEFATGEVKPHVHHSASATHGSTDRSTHPTSSHGFSEGGYDPLGNKNEGQVPVHGAEFATSEVKPHVHHSTGSTHPHEHQSTSTNHGSTSRSANISTHPTSSHGFSKDGYDPLGNENEGQVPVHGAEFATSDVKPHVHHSSDTTHGTTDRSIHGSTGQSTHSTSSHPTSSHGFSKGGYDPMGNKNEGQVPVHGAEFATGEVKPSDPVAGAFEGGSTQRYDAHGSRGVPVHETKLTGDSRGLTGSSAPVSGDFQGGHSQKYDPHGSKGDPAVPVHDAEFAAPPKQGLASKFDSLDHAGLGDQVSKHSKTAQEHIGKSNLNIGGHNSKEIGAGVAGAGALGAASLSKYGDRVKNANQSSSGASAPTSGDFEGVSTQKYDPHGSKGDPAVPVHDAHFATEQAKHNVDTGVSSRSGISTTRAPVSGDFEGGSTQRYDPHGPRGDPAVPVHDTEFAGAEHAKHSTATGPNTSSSTRAPVSGDFEGGSSQKYDPHGRKGDPAVPVHDTEFAAPPKQGLASKFDSLDHAGLGEQVSKHSKTAQDHIGKTNVNVGGHNSKEIGAGVAGAGALGAAGLSHYSDRVKGRETDATGYPVSGGFEGGSNKKYDAHGHKDDPTVPVHDTKFGAEPAQRGDYKTLDPAAKSEKYQTEFGHPGAAGVGAGAVGIGSTGHGPTASYGSTGPSHGSTSHGSTGHGSTSHGPTASYGSTGPSHGSTGHGSTSHGPITSYGSTSHGSTGSTAGPTVGSTQSTSKPIVTDGIQSANAPSKSIGTETGPHSNVPNHSHSHTGAGVAGGAAAGGLVAPHLQRAPDSQASVRSLDSRTAPVPDSHATVSGIPQGRFAPVNETSDNRRHSKESYGTSGETDFEDAIDYGSPEPHGTHHGGHHSATAGAIGAGALGSRAANDTDSVSSQSTIGKRQTAAPTTQHKPTTEAVAATPATKAVVPVSDGVENTGAPAVTSSGSASTGATKDTRPSTAATGASVDANNKAATGTKAHQAVDTNAPDYIPTNVLQQGKEKIGGDGSALEGPPIDKEKVEEMHEEVIQAAQADGHTQGITSSGAAAAAANVKGAPGKHAGKEGEDVASPDKKKGCRCC